MNHAEQMDWVDHRQVKDHDWAHHEIEVRRMAREVIDRLFVDKHSSITIHVLTGHADGFIAADAARPLPSSMSASDVTFYKHDIAYLGGLEGLLVVEEIIRRKMGLSREHELEQRIAAIRSAL